MTNDSKITRIEATAELLSEMEALQIFGGDYSQNPNQYMGCGGNVYCQGAQCVENCSDCTCNPNARCVQYDPNCGCTYNYTWCARM